MKKIVIYQENSDAIVLLDDDSTENELYTKEISKILESSKVCILETTSGNLLIKPSKVNSIIVTEFPEKNVDQEKVIENIETKEKFEKIFDVIKD